MLTGVDILAEGTAAHCESPASGLPFGPCGRSGPGVHSERALALALAGKSSAVLSTGELLALEDASPDVSFEGGDLLWNTQVSNDTRGVRVVRGCSLGQLEEKSDVTRWSGQGQWRWGALKLNRPGWSEGVELGGVGVGEGGSHQGGLVTRRW